MAAFLRSFFKIDKIKSVDPSSKKQKTLKENDPNVGPKSIVPPNNNKKETASVLLCLIGTALSGVTRMSLPIRQSCLKMEYKYSLEDYHAVYRIPRVVFRLVGIRLTRDDSSFARSCWNAMYWLEFLNVSIVCVLEVLQMAETAKGGTFEDLVLVFRMMPCIGYVVLGMAKSFNIVRHRPVFENLINELTGMWPQGAVSKEEYDVISKSLGVLNFIVPGWTGVSIILMLVYFIEPYFLILKRLAGYDTPMDLPFYYMLPFDPYQRVYFEIVLSFQFWHCFTSTFYMLSGDLLFCIFLRFIRTQFELLAYRIKRCVYVPVDDQLINKYPLAQNEDHEPDELGIQDELTIKKELDEIILRHIALIRLSDNVERMYTFSLLVNFMNSSIIICFCGFCSIYAEKWNEIVYKTFFLSAIFQIWLLCWFGQGLLESSTKVSEALYSCGWYTASETFKSSILIMIKRAQKEVHVTTYGFSVISLESYATIIKTSWSYFTLLNNVYSR